MPPGPALRTLQERDRHGMNDAVACSTFLLCLVAIGSKELHGPVPSRCAAGRMTHWHIRR